MLDEIYDNPQPGISCPGCGQGLWKHSDADCITTMTNAIKGLRKEVQRLRALERAVEQLFVITDGPVKKEVYDHIQKLLLDR
jgi:hypothetical protein